MVFITFFITLIFFEKISKKSSFFKKTSSVGYDLDPISILQGINSPTRGELHAGNSKNFQARIVTYKKGIRLLKWR